MSIIKKFLSDTAIYGLSTIVSRVLNFLLTPILTAKFKDAAIYGVFTQLYALSSFINALLAFGMETTYFRFLQRVDEKDRNKVFDNSFIVTLFTCFLFLVSVFSFTEPIGSWIGNESDVGEYVLYVKYFAVILVADAIAVIPFAKIRANGKPIRYSLLKIINILTYLATAIFFIFGIPHIQHMFPTAHEFFSWYKIDWIGYVFIANLIASLVTLICLLPEISTFKFRPDKKLLSQMFHYSWPILLANISFIINENLDKMIMTKLQSGLQGKRDLGIYGAVSKIAVFLNLFVTAFRLGAEPFFFSYAKNENSRTVYAIIMEYFVIAMVIGMVGISANLSWLKYFVGQEGSMYWTGLFIVPFILFNYVLLGIYMNLSIWYKLSDQTRYAFYISGAGAIITIMLIMLLVPQYSYIGAVAATTVSYMAMIAMSYFWGQKNYPIPYKSIKIIGYLTIGIGLSWVCYAVLETNFWWCNLLLISFIAFVTYAERKMILMLWKKMI